MLINPKDLSNFSAAVLSFQDKPRMGWLSREKYFRCFNRFFLNATLYGFITFRANRTDSLSIEGYGMSGQGYITQR